uniref:substrate-binding and VWA domain-containing protein n=1 Tax=Herbidospora sakaeratensis TaxID=564415 RepID=UPI0007855B6D|nr:substrate-binding and VWA domain-containing protein [Herbidospora sakaeratensis]
MKRPAAFGVAVVVSAALVAGLWWVNRPDSAPGCPQGLTEIRVASSQDKVELLREAAAGFGARACGRVVVDEVNSGTGMEALARGWDVDLDGPRPDVWAPTASVWLTLLEHRAKDTGGVAATAPPVPIVTSPLTIAMPKPMAEALGWPGEPIGWRDLAALARDPRGWGAHGHPEWGPFRLGKTNPNFSTSGLNATVAAFFAATGTTGDLTTGDVQKKENREFVRAIEQSIVHYGETAIAFLENMQKADDRGSALGYISAVTLEEKFVTDYNRGNPSGDPATLGDHLPPKVPLVAISPEEGTTVSDHPYIELAWMDAPKRTVAAAFLRHLHSPRVQERFMLYGYRSHDGATGPLQQDAAPLPGLLRPPSAHVLDAVLTSWRELRKPANVLLVLDVSGSMESSVELFGESALTLAKRAANASLGQFTDADRVGLWIFSTHLDGERDHLELLTTEPMKDNRDKLRGLIDGLTPGGGTGLYDTAAAALGAMAAEAEPGSINAVVLLTDGANEDDGLTLDNLITRVKETTSDEPVRLFTIGYGGAADQEVLTRMAEATDGVAYESGDEAHIQRVFTSVISNF